MMPEAVVYLSEEAGVGGQEWRCRCTSHCKENAKMMYQLPFFTASFAVQLYNWRYF